ncbi:DUF4142 domain-containing protein [Archangium sp.]|jgi:putative membrane protein|uniref:DUF4142 domain-containing protein n=1 Tax=Archangium sp. TaxID=1872627 RepID=UPI002ED7E17E
MKQTIQGFLLAGTLVLGGAALAQEGAKAQGKGAAKGGTAELRGFMVPTDEKALLERIHYTHQKEIKLGKLAQDNASNPDVKAFGEQMVREHTTADQQLMTMAQGRKLKLADMPKPMNEIEKTTLAADKANMEKLQTLKGEPFDSYYMSNMVADHDETLGKLMAGQQALAGNAELTSMMTTLTQSVTQHRQHAYTVLGKLGPQGMGTGGAKAPGSTGGTMAPTTPGTGTGTGTGTTGSGAGGTTGSGTQQPTK